MTTKWRLVACTLVGAAALGHPERATAIELLTAGDFEVPPIAAAPEVPFWTLQEFRTANPSVLVDSASLAGFADNPIDPLAVNPDDRGLWIKPFAGNATDGTVAAILSQIVAAVPGKQYSFTGDARFEANYGGSVGFSSDINFEMAFLDSTGSVIGSPFVRDLETEVINGLGWSGSDGNPVITPLIGVAPANAASVRVRAQGLNMTSNTTNTGQQSAFVDNFSLTTSDAPSSQLLQNANLNVLPPVPPTVEEQLAQYFQFIDNPVEAIDNVRIVGFANNPARGGVNGVWISPFVAAGQGGSGIVSQTVAGSAGTNYTFSADARWEAGFLGDASTTDENKAVIELAFLDGTGTVISSAVLDLRDDGKTANGAWSTHSVSATAPAGTVDVKVSGIISNLTLNTAPGGQSAFWDYFSLMADTNPVLPGDANGDGTVNLLDLSILGANFGQSPRSFAQGNFNEPADTVVNLLDLSILGANFGATSGALAVPEPGSALLVLAGVVLAATRRRV